MHPLTEVLLDDAATPATHLAGILGGDTHHLATSLLRFVATECDELPPSSIQDRCVEPGLSSGSVGKILPCLFVCFGLGTGCHVLNLQVFKHQRAILLDELARRLVKEIPATVAHLAGESSQFLLGACASMASLLATLYLAMRLLDTLFRHP